MENVFFKILNYCVDSKKHYYVCDVQLAEILELRVSIVSAVRNHHCSPPYYSSITSQRSASEAIKYFKYIIEARKSTETPLLRWTSVMSPTKVSKKEVIEEVKDVKKEVPAVGKEMSKAQAKKEISAQKADGIVIRQLKTLYSTRLLPIEKQYLFSKLHYPEILDSELSAKPTVLLVGQYSTGKTSFIKNLLGMDYPEIHIGPEVPSYSCFYSYN